MLQTKKGGYNELKNIQKNTQLDLILSKFISRFINFYNVNFDIYTLRNFIANIPNKFNEFNKIIPNLLLKNNEKTGLKIINKKPYEISINTLFKDLI